jgi:hypothetical protein
MTAALVAYLLVGMVTNLLIARTLVRCYTKDQRIEFLSSARHSLRQLGRPAVDDDTLIAAGHKAAHRQGLIAGLVWPIALPAHIIRRKQGAFGPLD